MTTANRLLVDYLVNCCLYYEMSANEISDFEFDKLAHQLRDSWNQVDHPHKELINYEALKETTSGAYITFPSIVRSIAANKARIIPGSATYKMTDAQILAYVIKNKGKNHNV